MAVIDRLKFISRRLGERLWLRPLVFCMLSIAAVFIAKAADSMNLEWSIPSVNTESVEALLAIMAASMLVIATFAVGSMISAYASASTSATPRSFTLIIADDVSKNALSIFIGSFIFSIFALTAAKNDIFRESGLAALFVLTVLVFGVVIITFVRWVDTIARLGRVGASVEKVEAATTAAMKRHRKAPAFGGIPTEPRHTQGTAVYAATVGYLQHIDIETLQAWAETANVRIVVAALPGTFAEPGRALAYVAHDAASTAELDLKAVADAFVIGTERLFEEDPRFGLVTLSEIADRALSSGVNDPGTAITIIGTLVRLFVLWAEPTEDLQAPKCDRVEVPLLSTRDMFDDAFTAMARDGAGTVEVMLRLQKAFKALSCLGDSAMCEAAVAHSRMALARAEKKLELPEDLALVREAAAFSSTNTHMDDAIAAK